MYCFNYAFKPSGLPLPCILLGILPVFGLFAFPVAVICPRTHVDKQAILVRPKFRWIITRTPHVARERE
jgi:hypothetical protein